MTCLIYFPIIFYIVNRPNEKIYKFCKTQPLINSISTSLTNASGLASRQLQQDFGGTVTQTIASDKIFYNSMFWAVYCRIVTQNIYLWSSVKFVQEYFLEKYFSRLSFGRLKYIAPERELVDIDGFREAFYILCNHVIKPPFPPPSCGW